MKKELQVPPGRRLRPEGKNVPATQPLNIHELMDEKPVLLLETVVLSDDNVLALAKESAEESRREVQFVGGIIILFITLGVVADGYLLLR